MDWYTWLYKTNLDPSLIYEYGSTFTRNELQEDDICHFNHEFLQSMGILVAKHRLEILKLARKDVEIKPNGMTRLVSAISKTKRLLAKKLSSSNKHASPMPMSEVTPYRTQWTGALRRINGGGGGVRELSHDNKQNAFVTRRRHTMKSGPLDLRVQEKLMVTNRSLSASGPLDGKVNERIRNNNWTPRRAVGHVHVHGSTTKSGPLGVSPKINFYCKDKNGSGFEEVNSLWSLMFQDMKPT
ncbi:hypothetical protein LIER_17235 [Lithospermum erythrorhizon]|uniref:SAM domain-containing protein n=1 Tax=Lithospermum erythrorhizon TaxID=34254 RepID=A0AAV3Q9N5_LITER